MNLKQEIAKKRLMKQGATEADIENIGKLPIHAVKYKGKPCRAAMDVNNNRFYILDENNNYTGKCETFSADTMQLIQTKYLPSISVKQPGESDEDVSDPGSSAQPTAEENGSTLPRKGSPAPAPGQRQVTPKVLLAACGICLVMGVLFTLLGVLLFGGDRSNDPLAGDQRFAVIQVVEDILPGTLITDDMLAKIVVSGETYNQVAQTQSTLYGWDDAPYIAGMYANEYIAAGECLTHNSVVGILDKQKNPYLDLEEGYEYLDIPVNLAYSYIDSVMIGRYLDIQLDVDTESNKKENVETEEIPGLNHSSTVTSKVVTDSYKFENIIILDMIAADGTSLFDTIATYNAVPDGELQAYLTRYFEGLIAANPDAEPDEWFKSFTIATIRIKLPEEQVKAIGRLDAENTRVKIQNIRDTFMAETIQQQDYLIEARYTTQVLALVMDTAY